MQFFFVKNISFLKGFFFGCTVVVGKRQKIKIQKVYEAEQLYAYN